MGGAVGVLAYCFRWSPEEVRRARDLHIGAVGGADIVAIGVGEGNIDIGICGNIDSKRDRYAL